MEGLQYGRYLWDRSGGLGWSPQRLVFQGMRFSRALKKCHPFSIQQCKRLNITKVKLYLPTEPSYFTMWVLLKDLLQSKNNPLFENLLLTFYFYSPPFAKMQQQLGQLRSKLKKDFIKRYKVKQRSTFCETKDLIKKATQVPQPWNHRSYIKVQKVEPSAINSGIGSQALGKTLREVNFSHHSDHVCMCSDCTCGRHLCRLNIIKPDLRKHSVYQKSYKPKMKAESIIVRAQETQPLKGAHLNLKSQYLKQYTNGSVGTLQRPKPKDQLRFQGPPQGVSTYGNMYPGHKGSNQYVMPTDRHRRGEFPFAGKTIYSTQFFLKKQSKKEYGKIPDQLKTGQGWLGASQYDNKFRDYNPEEMLPSIQFKQGEKYHKNLDFTHQFQTNYNNEFLRKKSTICPCKVMIEQNPSALISESKGFFRQNADFRGMSPTFHAISTSKHFYV